MIGFHVPILADPGWIALVVLLLVAASLGLGLLVAAVSDSEPQAVQLSLLLLLASVFFSGFVLAIDQFSEPVRSLIYALPVSNGIRLLEDFMFRGATVVSWQIGLMAALAAGYIAPGLGPAPAGDVPRLRFLVAGRPLDRPWSGSEEPRIRRRRRRGLAGEARPGDRRRQNGSPCRSPFAGRGPRSRPPCGRPRTGR